MMNREDWRERHARLDADEPGAPPGFLLDPNDKRACLGTPEKVPRELWDRDGDRLARGDGEDR